VGRRQPCNEWDTIGGQASRGHPGMNHTVLLNHKIVLLR
jgi:hypothetical protein